MRIALVGPGAFGRKHLDGLQAIEQADVKVIVDPDVEFARTVAGQYGVPRAVSELDEALRMDDVDAVILCTPTQLHAEQAIRCMRAGKHVAVEIPVADSLADAEEVLRVQKETGLVCGVGHIRRFNPPHQWIHRRIRKGELSIQQLDVQTFFFRRKNLNALGEPRTWTDHLLWHHAAHTVDLFLYQTGDSLVAVNAVEGPPHPELDIAMDMSIQMKVSSGALLTLSLSFNNDGPLGSVIRYICDNGTYIARFDELVDGYENPVDVSGVAAATDGVELLDRDFVAAAAGEKPARASIGNVIDCYRALHEVEKQLAH
jgi:2-hydroxy-4-carboxymuconate semialdehyde hemiacetal dehydrogenase